MSGTMNKPSAGMPPTVSVVIPLFNAASVIRETVASVLGQTFRDFELLIVDDGSTDDSASICASITDPRIRLIRQPNRGLAGARNAGIRHARGQYVAFLDADDLFLPDKLARHVDHLESSGYVGLSFSHSEIIGQLGRRTGKMQDSRSGHYGLADLILENPVGNGSAAVVRRSALAAVSYTRMRDGAVERHYFDEALSACEDVELWWRIACLTSWTVACLPEVHTLYRQMPHGMSSDTGRMLRGWDQAIAKTQRSAPHVVSRVERPARARFLRYLAGRAVAAGDGRNAWRHIRAALRSDPGLMRNQPRASLLTLAAAVSMCIIPNQIFRRAS
jgi:cellulose synthase/poly-beta-1,6-N-acetylglucosamine synthase-like glycosyltransferase